MNWLTDFYKQHGTKILGAATTLQAILSGFLAIQGLIPPAAVPYLAGVNVVLGALTIKRGFTNSAAGN